MHKYYIKMSSEKSYTANHTHLHYQNKCSTFKHPNLFNLCAVWQVLVTIKESQSVITWDFDVMKGDVQFTVFRHKRPREAVSSTSLSSFGSDVSLNQSGVIAGVDAVVVEKPRHCFDGESIQVYADVYSITEKQKTD